MNKKSTILLILNILERHTDAEKHITHAQIIRLLEKEHKVVCDRRTVSRNIKFLKEMGYEIETETRKVYLASRTFEDSELLVLIDGVLGNRYITGCHAKDLIEKLAALGSSRFYRSIKRVTGTAHRNTAGNTDFFLNAEVLSEAIETKKPVEFFYNKYGEDKKLAPTSEVKRVFCPYHLLYHTQRYYVIGLFEGRETLSCCRVDKISEISIIDAPAAPVTSIKGYSGAEDFKDIGLNLPYLFLDKPVEVVLLCEKNFIDDLVDWFGTEFKTENTRDGRLKARIKVSPTAMKYWLLQYGEQAEVILPQALRAEVAKITQKMYAKYSEGGALNP